jgi:hypothetical protein
MLSTRQMRTAPVDSQATNKLDTRTTIATNSINKHYTLLYNSLASMAMALCIVASALISSPLPASALQERNEVLCGTGFFTNIWQFRCTEIGDISDEGVATKLSNAQQESIDSLMSKFEMSEPKFIDKTLGEVNKGGGEMSSVKSDKVAGK